MYAVLYVCLHRLLRQAIEGVKCSSDHKVIDIMLILILHTCGYRKPVESLCRSKITAGRLSETLLRASFTAHAAVRSNEL